MPPRYHGGIFLQVLVARYPFTLLYVENAFIGIRVAGGAFLDNYAG